MSSFPHVLLGFLWIAYCLLHSLLANDAVKQRLGSGRIGNARYRILYTLFALLSFAAVLIYQLSVTSKLLFRPGYAVMPAAIVAGSCGLIIMGISISRYFVPLSGLREALTHEKYRSNAGDQLIVDGINGYVRHPLYLGTFIFIWSLWLLLPSLSFLISNTIITIYTILGAQLEERKLIKAFGEAYISYRKRVPMFIPWPW